MKSIAARKILKVSGVAKSMKTRLGVKVQDPEKQIPRAQDRVPTAESAIAIQIQMAKSTHWKLALVIRSKNAYRILSPRITKRKISKIL